MALNALSLCLELNPLNRDSALDEMEDQWVGSLSPQPSLTLPSKVVLPSWKFRLSLEELVDWKKKQQKWVLQFDGASKKNPRVAGGGGILFNPDGITEIKFAWGLGRKTNNQVEMYGLL